jgi:hypothetical protein
MPHLQWPIQRRSTAVGLRLCGSLMTARKLSAPATATSGASHPNQRRRHPAAAGVLCEHHRFHLGVRGLSVHGLHPVDRRLTTASPVLTAGQHVVTAQKTLQRRPAATSPASDSRRHLSSTSRRPIAGPAAGREPTVRSLATTGGGPQPNGIRDAADVAGRRCSRARQPAACEPVVANGSTTPSAQRRRRVMATLDQGQSSQSKSPPRPCRARQEVRGIPKLSGSTRTEPGYCQNDSSSNRAFAASTISRRASSSCS